ncbi:MAG: YodL domain-containing protein [Bacilli bacterium]|nr:YodL domain-containing protein [Bacilli bacterium]
MNIQIWQVKRDVEDDIRRDLMCMDYEWVIQRHENYIKNWKNYYSLIYEMYQDREPDETISEVLKEIFYVFNNNDTPVPSDFKGHSLSMSDIVVIDEVPYYCDTFGWRIIE